jgi:type II secretory pathway pseudopilin PulG
MVEAVVAISILAVASLGAAQALTFGLRTSGMSRERLAARAVADREMEHARSLNYDSLVLDDSSALAQSSDPTNPDYWIDATAQTYDPDQDVKSGTDENGEVFSLSPEQIIREAGASPALHHFQNPVVTGSTTFSIFMYVTWVDSKADDLVPSDVNTSGNDADGQDQKRFTVVVTWTDPLGGGLTSITQSSLFSDRQIHYHQPALNQPPVVSCPTATVSGLTVTFTAVATDPDGTIAAISWTGWDSLVDTGISVTHTYPAGGTYGVVTSATDNGLASADNAALSCTVSVNDPAGGNGGTHTGLIKILNDATYTNIVSVTLNITANPTPACMQFSNDGVTWSALQPYSTSSIWTLTSGDGVKTVYARFFDDPWPACGLYGPQSSDQITLDQTPPGWPTGLAFTTTTQGTNKTINLSWDAPSPATDVAGYQVWQRDTSGATWTQVTCGGSVTCTLTTLTETVKKTLNYEFYVVAYDLAGNTSAQSNHVTA